MDDENLIVVEEYKSSEVKNFNPLKDKAYLESDCFGGNRSNPPFQLYKTIDNHIKIRNTSYSGVIQLDKTRISFSTKVQTNLFYMLSFIKNEDDFLYDPEVSIEMKEGGSFFDVIGRLFLNELDEIIRRGLSKQYIKKK